MKEWTRDERYKVLNDPEELRDLHERTTHSPYRQRCHIQPVTGLSSDPNGFALHRGTWHLCYQWCPWGAVHGLKYWYHVTSLDLIHWRNAGIGLAPDRDYDNRGTHSGSAISVGDKLYYFYTGNHRDPDWTRTPYTCAAVLNAGGKLEKLPEPLFGPRPDYSEHQRDPKVVWNGEKQKFYIFLGAQTADGRGCVLIYESPEPLQGWRFAGELKVPGYERFGGMWECPYIVNLSGTDVLIFSPQYTKLPGRGESTNHNVYLLGHMDYDSLTFTPEGPYRFLDYGFDFYAAQGAANVPGGDRAILIAWIGLPDNHYPTADEDADWEGSMSLPRQLRVRDGKLVQTPLEGIETLREAELTPEGTLPECCELELTAPGGDFELNLFTRPDGSGGLRMRCDAEKKVCAFDKSGLDLRFNQNVGEALDMPLETPLKSLRIFIDRCSTEIFANGGEATFTAHTYPTEREHGYTVSNGAGVRLWRLGASVVDDFVV